MSEVSSYMYVSLQVQYVLF